MARLDTQMGVTSNHSYTQAEQQTTLNQIAHTLTDRPTVLGQIADTNMREVNLLLKFHFL